MGRKNRYDAKYSQRKQGSNKMSCPPTSPTSPTTPTTPPSPSDFIFRVILSYGPQHDGQLPLTTGDVVTDVKDLGNGWALGRNVSRDLVGIFPSKCIRPMSDVSPSHQTPRSAQRSKNKPPPPPQPRKVQPVAREGAPSRDHYLDLDASEAGHSSQQQPQAGIDHANTLSHLSSVESEVSTSDIEFSSLPTPKRVRKSAIKPHLVVKPNNNQGKGNTSKMSGRMEPMIREIPGSEDSEDEGARLNGPITADHYGPAITAAKIRTANPPGQLPLSAASPHKRQNKHMDSVDSRHKMALLEAGITDQSTSHITAATDMDPQYVTEDIFRENLVNETLQQSPNLSNREKYASINKPYYRDYRTLECPADGNYQAQLRYKPILKHRHQKVADSSNRGQHIHYREEAEKRSSCTLIIAIFAGLQFASVMFLWMYYYLSYPFFVAVGLCAAFAILLIACFALSRMCRCMAAILLPSLCTTRGRIAFLILLTGFLLNGPVTNIYYNMSEVSRSMSCSAEQTYNQTMLLLKPFDGMMVKLNETVLKLQTSAHEVHRGLRPLEQGLGQVEMDIYNGHIQLMGTRKTCMTLVSKAYNACSSGIVGAQDQCLGVMGALGTVYHHARDVLDRINPEHWAPKHHLLLQKRQVIIEGSNPEVDISLPNNDRDICEDLDVSSVCSRLNDSASLCMPSHWAGEAIQEAVNETQAAMATLEEALQFRVTSEPYNTTRIKASKMIYEVQMKVQRDFAEKTTDFELIISVVLKVIPLAVLLLVYVAYNHVKNYLCSDTYDNTYITEHLKALDMKRSEVAGENLLPLKRYEKNFLIDTTSPELSPPEDGLYRIGLCVIFLHFLVSFTCYTFDYILYWILALIDRYANPTFDATGRDSLEMVVTGEGVIVDLLDIFLKGFHPGQWFGFSANTQECIAKAHEPDLKYLVVICLMYFIIIVIMLLKAYILRIRNRICGYVYPERRKARIVHLYNVILNQRLRFPKLLHQRARLNYREQQTTEKVAFCHQVAAHCAPCRAFLYAAPRCLVCLAAEDETSRDCDTDKCYGTYCADCYEDLGRVCPLCLHGDEGSDEDDYEDLEDDLQPYHRSSKIYL